MYWCKSCNQEVDIAYQNGKYLVHGIYDAGNACECGPVVIRRHLTPREPDPALAAPTPGKTIQNRKL